MLLVNSDPAGTKRDSIFHEYFTNVSLYRTGQLQVFILISLISLK